MTTIVYIDQYEDFTPGEYVPLAEYAALAAERDALRALVERVNELGHRLGGNYAWQNAELVQLLRDCQEALK